MPRLKIEELKNYAFSTELEVRVTDLNYGAHLAYDRLLGLAHQARVRWFGSLGVSELDLGDGKAGILAADVGIVYQGEAFVCDQLTFALCPMEVGRRSFRLAHRVVRQDGKKIALIEMGFVAFDYAERKPVALPAVFREQLLQSAETTGLSQGMDPKNG